jgi:hypothetical protein
VGVLLLIFFCLFSISIHIAMKISILEGLQSVRFFSFGMGQSNGSFRKKKLELGKHPQLMNLIHNKYSHE